MFTHPHIMSHVICHVSHVMCLFCQSNKAYRLVSTGPTLSSLIKFGFYGLIFLIYSLDLCMLKFQRKPIFCNINTQKPGKYQKILCFGSFLKELPFQHRHFSGTVPNGNASINLDKTAPLDHLRKIVRNVFMHFVRHCSVCILQKTPQKKKSSCKNLREKHIIQQFSF